jgi:formylglycine-generating enzyme
MFRRTVVVGMVSLLIVLSGAIVAHAIVIETVPVGNPGNDADTNTYGHVAYDYNIGKYEVTAGQYCAFLNAVAASDPHGLYNGLMDSNAEGCQITQHGTSGSFTYDFSGRPSGTEADWSNRPVNYVNFGDAVRFANWLHNGQPTGPQGPSTTEDGAYDFTHGATPSTVTRETDWKWAIPSEDEWHKAAFHKNNGPTGDYWTYATGTNNDPSNVLGSPTDPGNNATYLKSGVYTIGAPYYRTEVGAHENSESPYGTFDQDGNVFEWTDQISTNFSYCRECLGGSYSGPLSSMRKSLVNPQNVAAETASVGIRVVSTPEPGSMTLLMCGAIAAWMLRGRWLSKRRRS